MLRICLKELTLEGYKQFFFVMRNMRHGLILFSNVLITLRIRTLFPNVGAFSPHLSASSSAAIFNDWFELRQVYIIIYSRRTRLPMVTFF